MSKTTLEYIWTEDQLRLPGVHYQTGDSQDTCIVMVPGMSGTILENYFAHVLGTTISDSHFAFIYGHNRGYSHINDVRSGVLKPEGNYQTIRTGTSYERFADCLLDIDAWIDYALQFGYRSIILMGHSLGAVKTVYYYQKRRPETIAGLALVSAPDIVGLAMQYEPRYASLLAEARANIAKDQPRQLLSALMWDWFPLSSQTFVDLFEEGGPADVLPLLRNPATFEALKDVEIPVLAVSGELDDVAIRGFPEDLILMKTKAESCRAFSCQVIAHATHSYERYELQLAQAVLEWLRQSAFAK